MRRIEDVTLKDGRRLKEVFKLHKKWLEDEEDGKRADLSDENLSDVDLNNSDLRYIILRGTNLSEANLISSNLRGVNLTYANLRGSDLRGANLTYANLRGSDLEDANLSDANLIDANLISSNLKGADLRGSDLRGVDLKGSDLKGADLKGANLTRANLSSADLKNVKYNNTTSFFALQCQEEGSFIGYKKANNKIVKLLITKDAKRSSATTRKCRCSKAKVLSITSISGEENFEKVASDYDLNFIYKVGEIVEVKDFDENRWNECSTGIHFFITREEAVTY